MNLLQVLASVLTIATLVLGLVLSTIERCTAGSPPSLESITPPVATRGTEFTLRAIGSSLGDCQEVLFYSKGLESIEIKKVDDDTVDLRIQAAADCELRAHPFRLRSSNGLSEIRTITITPFPTIMENDQEEPQKIVGNQTVVGTLQSDDTDRFVIEAQAGDVISAEIVAMRLGVKMLDTELTLYGPDQSALLRVDDTPLLNQDPCLSFRVSKEGTYTLQISTVGSNADANSPYAMHIGNFPRPTMMVPLGGQAGSPMDVEWVGTYGSAGEPLRQSVILPASNDPIASYELSVLGSDGKRVYCPSSIPVRAVAFQNDVAIPNDVAFQDSATQPADSPSAQQPTVAPVAFHGSIDAPAKLDHYSFRLPHAGYFTAEVFAARLGSLLDSVIEVRDETNQRTIASGDDLNSHDPAVTFEGDPSHVYSVRIRDKRLKSGDLFVYRLEIRPYQPNLISFLPRRDKLSQAGQTVSLPRGNRTLAIMAVRRDGVDSSVRLSWDGMPSEIKTYEAEFDANTFARPVVLESAADAPLGAHLVRPNVQAGDVRGGFQQIVDLVNGPADALYTGIATDRLAVAITEPLPYSIELDEPSNPLSVDGTLELKVRVQRQPGFGSPIELRIPLLPEFVDAPAKVRVEPNQTEATITLTADERCYPQSWPLVVEAKIGSGRSESSTEQIGAIDRMPVAVPLTAPPVCSSLRNLKIISSPARGSVQPVAAECGQTITIPFRFDIDPEFAGELVAQLEGLPNRVTAKPISMGKDQRSVEFELQVSSDAPIGTFENLSVRLSGNRMDQSVSYSVSRKTVLVIAPLGKSYKDASGRPLSPLEALRQTRNRPGL